jgi:hypothetical protein
MDLVNNGFQLVTQRREIALNINGHALRKPNPGRVLAGRGPLLFGQAFAWPRR